MGAWQWAGTYFSLSLDGWPPASANIMQVMNRKLNACKGNKYKDYDSYANVRKRLSPAPPLCHQNSS